MSKKKKSDTIRIKFSLSIGLSGCTQEETIEYDRKEWESYSDEDKEEELRQFIQNHADAYFEELEEQ